jgi:hypothetical protein
VAKRSSRDEPIWGVIHMHGNDTRNLSVEPSLSQASKNSVFLIISYVFSSTKSEEVLPGSGGGKGGGPNNIYTCG